MKNIDIASRHAPTLWVLVADGRQGCLYRMESAERQFPLPGNARHPHYETTAAAELTEIPGMRWQSESAEDYQVGRNATGMVFESSGGARHMSEPHQDARREVKEHFASTIAQHVNRARKEQAFDQLVVVAPPKMLGALREHFDQETSGAIRCELSRELTHLSTHDLLPHIRNALEKN